VKELERVIEAIEKHMRVLDRQARKCSKSGDHVWSAHYMARVMGLLDARNLCLEEVRKSENNQRNSSSST
jgi:hypothetical protein